MRDNAYSYTCFGKEIQRFSSKQVQQGSSQLDFVQFGEGLEA
jgi:hypothetical protein